MKRKRKKKKKEIRLVWTGGFLPSFLPSFLSSCWLFGPKGFSDAVHSSVRLLYEYVEGPDRTVPYPREASSPRVMHRPVGVRCGAVPRRVLELTLPT